MATLWNRAGHHIFALWLLLSYFFFMAALRSRCGHYVFILWFLLAVFLFLFSLPNLSRQRLDVYHTSTHGVALVQMQI